MEVLLVEPGKEARIAEIGSDLKSLQAAVGGYIEAAYFFDDPVALICNEEGRLLGLQHNCTILGETQVDNTKYLDMFKYPEKFTAIGGKLVITQDKPRAAPARQEAER